jgi:hypothetical protein
MKDAIENTLKVILGRIEKEIEQGARGSMAYSVVDSPYGVENLICTFDTLLDIYKRLDVVEPKIHPQLLPAEARIGDSVIN